MSQPAPKGAKGQQTESDLSQVMAHGPALCEAYGRFWGAVLMMLAIGKTRRGSLGIMTTIGVFGATIYQMFRK